MLVRSEIMAPEWARVRRVSLRLLFVPPDRRRRDDDNLIASFKPYRDGISDALGIDDAHFRTTAEVSRKPDPKKRGFVRVTIIPLP